MVGDLRIDLRAGNRGMSHHLGNTLNRYTSLQCQRTERMASHVKGKGLANATSQANSLEVHAYLHSTHRGCEDRTILFLVFQWIKREYLLGYRVQRRDALYSCLLSVLTDIAYSGIVRLNITVPQSCPDSEFFALLAHTWHPQKDYSEWFAGSQLYTSIGLAKRDFVSLRIRHSLFA